MALRKNNKISCFVLIGFVTMYFNCVSNRDFDAPNMDCEDSLVANITIAELKEMYTGEVMQILEELVLEAIVISSDKEGNFFSVLHCQDTYENPTNGIQLEIDMQDSYLFYPVGSKVLIRLKGLYLGESKDVYKLGGVFTSFGNISVGRLPALSVKQHLFLSCNTIEELIPRLITITEIDDSLVSTLITLSDIEFTEDELGLMFAEKEEETERILEDCFDNELQVINSGYSNFQSQTLPSLRGSITGVVSKSTKGYQLIIRSLEDIVFSEERCEEVVDEFTSTSVFISELADPDNNSSGRFVELYNAGDSALSLKSWKLQRYTNSNTEVSSAIDLTGSEIAAKSTIVLAASAEDFNTIYGFAPSLDAGSNSPADSNGDDNLVLLDPFGNVIDVFGVVGEDGSGTNHEFEDGRALRNSNILIGNPIYTFSEWEIFNDTGGNGTTNNPQVAPDNYSPGIHN